MRPTMIQLESSTACDAKCVFCPHSKLKRQGGQMSDGLFHKILDESDGITEILLFLNGEPLIFPRLFDWLELLRQHLKTTTIFTNANALTPEKAEKLVSYSDVIRSIVFSLGGINEETYSEIMGLDFNRVKLNVAEFKKINNGKIYTTAHIPYFSKTATFAADWLFGWGDLVDDLSPTAYFNFAGLVSDPLELRENGNHSRAACGRLNHLTVLFDGRVCLCCMDAEGEILLGNLNTDSLDDIFNGNTMTYFREMHAKSEWDKLPLCKDCNMNIIRVEQ